VAGLDEALKNWRPNSERGRIVVSYLWDWLEVFWKVRFLSHTGVYK
jgi:hypothetical protein